LQVWPRFVAAAESLTAFEPLQAGPFSAELRQAAIDEHTLIEDGQALISWLAGARVPMPKSTRDYILRCEQMKPHLLEPQATAASSSTERVAPDVRDAEDIERDGRQGI
ncbi:MAG: hypothetical protein K0U93_11685, partial [Gammaproteobacteria bacterium]|nr:hypothetical protein [Gammaproteobacteria bacterium]